MSENRLLGKVRKLKQNFGFIAGDDGIDYFFHWTSMRKNDKDFRKLELLDRVEFSPIELLSGEEMKHRAIEISVVSV